MFCSNEHRTPLLGIPLSNDQKSNLFDAGERGIAHVIPWNGLSKEQFIDGIQTVLDDNSNRYICNIEKEHSIQTVLIKNSKRSTTYSLIIFISIQLSKSNKSFA